MGVHSAEQQIEISVPPEVCFEAITDYETFTEWQQPVRAVEVLDRYPDGLGRTVELTVDAKVREVHYRLRYHYDRPHRIWWDFLEGRGIEHIEGEYLFEPIEDGTLATYRVGIDPGVRVPGFLARRLNEGVMRSSVEELKAEAERRG
jgi:uncharacterized membrane protein